MSRTLLIIAGIGGVYLLLASPSSKVYKKSDVNANFRYNCSSLEIYNVHEFEKIKKQALNRVFKKLNIPVDKIYSFKDYVIPFVKNYINEFTTNCIPKTKNERILYYILASQAINNLITLDLGEEIYVNNPKYEKWNDISFEYFDILISYLSLTDMELEINKAFEQLYSTKKYP